MTRRVKHGLDPIPTEEEEREIEEREKRERLEEERLYLLGEKERGEDDDVEGEEKEDGSGGEEEEHESDDDESMPDELQNEGEEAVSGNIVSDDETKQQQHHQQHRDKESKKKSSPKTQSQQSNQPANKKTKRNKPVPDDYVCQACQNQIAPPHWIYDCPNKVTQRGCNQVAKKLRGLHDPASRKVFVSGLPFDATEGSVQRFFDAKMIEEGSSSQLVHCKLLKFEDSQRCKGQAFLTFDSDEAAKRALKLSGMIWEDVEEEGVSTKKKGKGKKNKGEEEKKEKKELRLKVSKVLNRFVTKQKKGH